MELIDLNATIELKKIRQEDIVTVHDITESRYSRECQDLCNIAICNLNMPKNVQKGPFEEMTLEELLDFFNEEYEELKESLEEYEINKTKNKYEHILYEMGDMIAYLAGILAKLKTGTLIK